MSYSLEDLLDNKQIRDILSEINSLSEEHQVIVQPDHSDNDSIAEAYVEHHKNKSVIHIKPSNCSVHTLSHELLHIIHNDRYKERNMISCISHSSYLATRLQPYISNCLSHPWIINEQRKRGISGTTDYVEGKFNNYESYLPIYSGSIVDSFDRILDMGGIKNDYPDEYDGYHQRLMQLNPLLTSQVDEMALIIPSDVIMSPFTIHRIVSAYIDKWIKATAHISQSFQMLKHVLCVLPVFRKEQLQVACNTLIDCQITQNHEYQLYVKIRQQACSPAFTCGLSASQMRQLLDSSTIRDYFARTGLPYFLDDRCGSWSAINYAKK